MGLGPPHSGECVLSCVLSTCRLTWRPFHVHEKSRRNPTPAVVRGVGLLNVGRYQAEPHNTVSKAASRADPTERVCKAPSGRESAGGGRGWRIRSPKPRCGKRHSPSLHLYVVTVLLNFLRASVPGPVSQPCRQSRPGRELQQSGDVCDVTKEILLCENLATVVAAAPAATPWTVGPSSLFPQRPVGERPARAAGSGRAARRRPDRPCCLPAAPHGAFLSPASGFSLYPVSVWILPLKIVVHLTKI